MGKRKTQEQYLNEVRSKHGDFYDYSATVYTSALAKVLIICPYHGPFKQIARNHADGQGCPECAGVKKYTTKSFTSKATIVHNNKYDYSRVEYVNSNTSVTIICKQHGEFQQTPAMHLSRRGCPRCKAVNVGKQCAYTLDDFKRLGSAKHNNKYDYSESVYVNSVTKLTIICPDHGKFYQRPAGHLIGKGCSKCKGEECSKRQNFTNQRFLEKARKKHGNVYTYFGDYVGMNTPIDIECRLHGIFTQRPASHLQGQGCPECRGAKISKTKTLDHARFLEVARKKHGSKYAYVSEYVTTHQKIDIECKKHGLFRQTPHNHLQGQGCPTCKVSRGEEFVARCLDEMEIGYIRQFTFDKRRTRTSLRFDFYLPELNTCIEYDGIQHFCAIDLFGGEEGLKETQTRDEAKNKLANRHNVELLRVTYMDLADRMILTKIKEAIDLQKRIAETYVWYTAY